MPDRDRRREVLQLGHCGAGGLIFGPRLLSSRSRPSTAVSGTISLWAWGAGPEFDAWHQRIDYFNSQVPRRRGAVRAAGQERLRGVPAAAHPDRRRQRTRRHPRAQLPADAAGERGRRPAAARRLHRGDGRLRRGRLLRVGAARLQGRRHHLLRPTERRAVRALLQRRRLRGGRSRGRPGDVRGGHVGRGRLLGGDRRADRVGRSASASPSSRGTTTTSASWAAARCSTSRSSR